jgi:hypothetical protein
VRRSTRGSRRRGRAPAILMSVAAAAVLAGGCASSAALTTAETPPADLARAAGYSDSQAMKSCLRSYGISRQVMREVFNGASPAVTGMTGTRLKVAGLRCWGANETGLTATAFRRIDKCLAQEGVATAHTGSPLADVLVEMTVHTARARGAMGFCLRT